MRAILASATIALALFLATAPEGVGRVTDVAALRVLDGDLPYRDFWTMYAPGSIVLAAGAFALLGERMIVSNVAGALVAAASVGALHALALRALAPRRALVVALLYALAFFSTLYRNGLTSYPLAILFGFLALDRLARRSLVAGGAWLGAASLFKHDVACYLAVAGAIALALELRSLRPVLPVALAALAVAAVGYAPFAVLAGEELLHQLLVFPATTFREVRDADLPGLGAVLGGGTALGRARALCQAITVWGAGAAWLLGLAGFALGRRAPPGGARFAQLVALLGFPLFWLAASVQVNTHAITLTALGFLAGAAVLRAPAKLGRRVALRSALALFALAQVAEPGHRLLVALTEGGQPIGVERLVGIRATPAEVRWMRGLARAIDAAAPRGSPLFVAAARNDGLIYCDVIPYWLSDRAIATRHHELHPGVTDVERVQREIVAALEAASPPPVVVREHRFGDAAVERFLARRRGRVPLGATLLDEWIDARYAPGERFGPYEVLARR